jgi:solute carrier family 41
MSSITELIMIVPVILNLKGNLEMNLSSRLGTAANMGELDDPTSRNAIVFGNLSLLQLQAAVVSFVAANAAFILGHFVPAGPAEQEDPFPELDPGNNGTLTNGTIPANTTTVLANRTLKLLLRRKPGRIPYLPTSGAPKFGLFECVSIIELRLGFTSSGLAQIHPGVRDRYVRSEPIERTPGLVHVHPRRPMSQARS